MELNSGNTYITEHKDGYSLNIQMPDGSRNYLHHTCVDLESAIIIRELLDECSIDHMNLKIVKDEGYYRLSLNMRDCNDDFYRFHSRKLNLNDVVYERMQLIIAD